MTSPDNRPDGMAPGATPDAVVLLTAGHRRVRQLFDEYAAIAGQAGQEDCQSELSRQIGVRRQEIDNGFDGAPAPEKTRAAKSGRQKPAQP